MEDYERGGGWGGGREDHRDAGGGGGGTLQRLDSIQDPGKRYTLKDRIGSGVCGDVFEATDLQAGNKKVAIKVQKLTQDTQALIVEEYRVLRDFAGHPNLPEFYGIYRRRSGKKTEPDQVWFVMEFCEGGSVMDLVRGLAASDKKLKEEHIGYILKEVVKALLHLHENNVVHRDVRGNNILLTKNGEVKLVDFGLSRMIKGELGKRKTCIGSPCWMAPEVVTSKDTPETGYGSRVDVWAIGITAIELADGKPPFQDMHPSRALFQIIRNPPPNLYRPANWTQNFNDFIAECLEKNPDNRPFMAEIMEHPFLSELPENDYPLAQDLKALAMDFSGKGRLDRRPEVIVRTGHLKTHQTGPLEKMLVEDLAALEHLSEDAILDELQERLKLGYFQSFVGDVLLILNPNEEQDIYGAHFHTKYQCKSRSDNAPHIYAVGDSAYQDVLHNEEGQHIIFAGESYSGKTRNMMHVVRHLMYLGKGMQDAGVRVFKAIEVIHAMSNAATPLNPNSTRCVLQIQTTFGTTGKASGAIFMLYQLEKWRISTRDRNQSNFHIFYYFYDGLDTAGQLRQYSLTPGRRYRYLRISDKTSGNKKRSFKVRNDPHGNSRKFQDFKEALKSLEMEAESETIWKTLAAILILGEVKFAEGNNSDAEIENSDVASKAAELLGVDVKKFSWSLTNYCLIKKGSAVRRRHTVEEAKEARDVLANTIYQRLVDWTVNNINYKLSVTRTLFGDKYCINVLDLFGFECFAVNRIEQLFVNTMNEQLQCHYNQRVFVWEMQEQQEEEIPVQQLHFYDNREAVEQLMGKTSGLFRIIEDASRQLQDAQYICETLKTSAQGVHVKGLSNHEFSIAHYTGKLVYDASEISEKNRDFVPPEMIETMRLSSVEAVVQMFTNQLTRSGNLTMIVQQPKPPEKTTKGKWSAILLQENTKTRKFNTASRGQFSQTRKMRTCSATFRSASLEILKTLSVGGGSGGTHFVRCLRSDLEGVPRGFYREVVRQQIRALAVLDTAKARQRGYPHRIPFQEFLRRYKFLAFDFDENVELTKDNCRLLLVRLKMEGWVIGKTKVFLKYYNEEYLSRLYETQVKKIIKVQCMMRAFLARKSMASKIVNIKKTVVKQASITAKENKEMSQEDAAVMIQKAYRGHSVRKHPLPKGNLKSDHWDQETKNFMMFYSSKWRSKSMFQVLLHYRAARYQDLVHFSQQVHLFNQSMIAKLQTTSERVPLERINPGVKASLYLGERRLTVNKLPFDMNQELPYFDSSYMSDPTTSSRINKPRGSMSTLASEDEHEPWDAPLRRQTVPWGTNTVHTRDVEVQTTNSPHRVVPAPMTGGQSLINTPFSRDPNIPVKCPPAEVQPAKPTRGYPGPSSAPNPTRARVNNADLNQGYSGGNDGTGSIRSRKKIPPPPIPQNQKPLNNNYGSEMRSGNLDSGYNNEWEFEDRMNRNTVSTNRVNPIHEMQMMARKNNNNYTDDEPPFNFQGMLRKTQHHRASMKRSQIYNSHTPSPPPYMGHNSSTRDDSYGNGNVVYRSSGMSFSHTRRESPEWSPNEMVRMSEKYGREDGWDRDERENVLDASESITTEIAPGIIVEGYVADL
ncbi:neither inactivation nor afterpotential protein C isoform X1 [Neodiprion virginianus]|uniref:neither inactivation nor afterpotential protein C isoform X1 n=1 Tax=Neodiprion virginianus TaxID=2961670 RepID=UPI001EE77763|nr:neither inactivation nor afterpotential protein C isoform X1 [Neodiprion virginianus]